MEAGGRLSSVRQMNLQGEEWDDCRKKVTWRMSDPAEADLDLNSDLLIPYPSHQYLEGSEAMP